MTDVEVHRRFPCDDFVTAPTLQAWRGITVHAPPARVWPWIVQIRIAPYSYDWIDNLARPSPRELRSLADPHVGDPFTHALGKSCGKIVAVEREKHLTGSLLGAFMSYALTRGGPSQTRLVLKVVSTTGPVVSPLLCLGDLVMARKQLRTLARLAELTS